MSLYFFNSLSSMVSPTSFELEIRSNHSHKVLGDRRKPVNIKESETVEKTISKLNRLDSF